jgi:hypothetical protein
MIEVPNDDFAAAKFFFSNTKSIPVLRMSPSWPCVELQNLSRGWLMRYG